MARIIFRRKLLKIALLAGIFSLLSWLAAGLETALLEALFFDIGQGDAALIRTTGGRLILVDAGPDDMIMHRLGKSVSYFRRRIDYVLVSHPHDDHIGGLISVLERYQVRHLIYAQSDTASERFEAILETAERRGTSVHPLAAEAMISLDDGCRLHLINPEMLSVPDDENNSLVLHAACGGWSLLLSGDNSARVEKSLVASGFELVSTIFKASHHGSKTANSLLFLKAIDPEAVIISAGRENRFGHPHQEVLERVQDLGVEIRRTDSEGSIRASPAETR